MMRRFFNIEIAIGMLCDDQGEAEGPSIYITIGRLHIQLVVGWHNRRCSDGW